MRRPYKLMEIARNYLANLIQHVLLAATKRECKDNNNNNNNRNAEKRSKHQRKKCSKQFIALLSAGASIELDLFAADYRD